MRLDVRLGDLDHDDAVQLIDALDAEIAARYDEPVASYVLALGPDEVAPGHGALALARLGDEVVGCGAVRLIDEDTAEVKRMFVVPEFRGRNAAREILGFLEAQARAMGASRVVLETVTDPPAAVALYRSAGYEEIPRFGPYAESDVSFCMGKFL